MAFWVPWPPLGQPWVPLGSPLCPTCAQSLLQIEIWSISENVCFPICFQWFLRVGGASKAPKGRLEGPLGGTLGPKVTAWTHIFAIRILVRFLSAKNRRCAAVKVKGLRQRLARRRGGRLRSPSFAEVLYTVVQHALLPLSRGAADFKGYAHCRRPFMLTVVE